MKRTEKPTSIKQLVQSMQTQDITLLTGIVRSAQPLEIQIVNDEKLIIDEDNTHIPKHLTDYKVKITIPSSGGHSQYSGSGVHSHERVEATIYNALKQGDYLMILGTSSGQFYVIDRMESDG